MDSPLEPRRIFADDSCTSSSPSLLLRGEPGEPRSALFGSLTCSKAMPSRMCVDGIPSPKFAELGLGGAPTEGDIWQGACLSRGVQKVFCFGAHAQRVWVMHARERSALRRLAPLGGGTALRQQREGWGVRASSHIVHRTSYIVFHRYIDPSFHVHRFETRAQHEFGRPSHISRVTAHKHKVPVQYPSSIGSPTLEPARPHPCLQFFPV